MSDPPSGDAARAEAPRDVPPDDLALGPDIALPEEAEALDTGGALGASVSVYTTRTTVVTCRLTGNFPGSPVDLRFFFELEGDKIASLEVIP